MDHLVCARSFALKRCSASVTLTSRSSLPIQTQCTTNTQYEPPNKRLRLSSIQQQRLAHSRRNVSSTASPQPEQIPLLQTSDTMPTSAMSCIPLSSLLRSYFITAISSKPYLVRPSIAVLSFLAHSKSPLLNPDTSPLLKAILKKTFYAQFCAGEAPPEVRSCIDSLKQMGYKGVILGHAKEVVMTKVDAEALDAAEDCQEQQACNAREIGQWKETTIATIDLAQKDDFVALKFSGAGRQALQHLKAKIPCAPDFEQAVHEMCQRAQERGVGLLFDAEQDSIQEGIDNWTIYFARAYNKGDRALVYGTYQAYKIGTPAILARHLDLARREGFVLGVKLVRGAYLNSDPRELFWPTVGGTHQCYDGIAKAMMERKCNEVLPSHDQTVPDFPEVNLVLASHNAASVEKARELRNQQAETGVPRIRMAYGQLQGMADNVSTALVQAANQAKDAESSFVDVPRPYKYLVWGKMSECMKYLLRRAQENKDAVTRTVEARKALGKELARRCGLAR